MPLLAFLAAAAVVSIFIIPALLTRREGYRRTQDYFVSSDHVLPKVIQNSCIAYAIGLATYGPFFAWGARGNFWPAILHAAVFGLGLTLLYASRRPMLKFLGHALSHDRSVTVHEFIALRHGNDPLVRAVAAALTVCALSGLIICETLGLATVLKPLLSGSENLTHLFIAAVLAVVVSCTLLSGHAGIMHAAQLQLGIIYFGLFGSMTFLMYLQMSDIGLMPAQGTFAAGIITVLCAVMYFYRRVRYVDSNSLRYCVVTADRDRQRLRFRLISRFQKILNAVIAIFMVLAVVVAAIDLYVGGIPTVVHDTPAALQAGMQVSNATLISLVLLPLFHPIVDVVNWQRLAAFEKERDWNNFDESKWTAAFKSFFATYAAEVPLVKILICMFGAIAGLTLATPKGGGVGHAFIAQLRAQENFVATATLSFLLLSLFAMAVSTMSSLFAASLCTVHYDILRMFWSKPMFAQARSEKAEAIPWTMIAGAGLGFAV